MNKPVLKMVTTTMNDFDRLCERVRIKEFENSGLNITNTIPWDKLDDDLKDMYCETVRATLQCLAEDGFDFGSFRF